MSRGSEGAAESAVIADLAVMTSAIDLYTTEHIGDFPTSAGSFANQMTLFTDVSGNTSGTKGAGFIYGPYLRAIPPLPAGPQGCNYHLAAHVDRAVRPLIRTGNLVHGGRLSALRAPRRA